MPTPDHKKVNIQNEYLSQPILMCFIVILLFINTCILSINLYSTNRGFNFWDESYYLLSYKMAAQTFYAHFNNTPFVVAFFLERFNPGLVGYRIIHFITNIFAIGLFAFAVNTYIKSAGIAVNRLMPTLMYGLAFFGAMYTYQISVTTLSYNHINEFLVLVSEALLLLSLTLKIGEKTKLALLFISGMVAALDIYIKPPTFVLLISINIIFLFLFLSDTKKASRYSGATLFGCMISITLSILSFYPMKQWVQYLNLMATQQAHSPYKVISSFLNSGFDMIRAGLWVIVSGSAIIGWIYATTAQRKLQKAFVFTGASILFVIHGYFVVRLLFPSTIWTSFNVIPYYWSLYSSTVLVVIIFLISLLGLSVLFRRYSFNRKTVALILLLLAVNPIMMSVGTLNGFGQVQIYETSWLLLSVIVLCVCFYTSEKLATIYVFILITILLCVGSTHFIRQIMPKGGQNALYAQVYSLKEFAALKHVLVDKQTYELLIQIKSILDKYPNSPTISFFDMPGLQYAFGRQWVILDPWLSNFEHPKTGDDAYNCRIITDHPEKFHNTVFIVSFGNNISAPLMHCLVKIGYPHEMQFLGNVHTAIGDMNEPINLYLHP